MKYWLPILLLVSTLAFTSCSSDDDTNDGENETSPTLFFPLLENSSWTYENMSDQVPGTLRDSLYWFGSQQLDNETYSDLDALQPANGFMTQIFAQNLLRTTDTQLLINGDLSTAVFEGLPEISIPLDDTILYDLSQDPGVVLDELSGMIEQDFNGIPLVVNYNLLSIQGEQLEEFIAGGVGYENVLSSQVVANIEVNAQVEFGGITLDIPVLSSQDVIITTNYYAENIGLIFSEFQFQYQLEDLGNLGVDVPFPNEINTTSTQTLDIYFPGN